MAYEEIKSSGITASTPENIMLGAGTIHKGLKLQNGKWNFAESILGATSGGGKLSIVPEITDIEVDGAYVAVKGLRQKMGETASAEVNLVEMTPELLSMCLIGEVKESTDYTGFTEITSKSLLSVGDYIENFAYIGRKSDGTPLIFMFDQCVCTSGFEIEGKNKEAGVFKAKFECVADITPECDTLPWRVLYPTAVNTPSTPSGANIGD